MLADSSCRFGCIWANRALRFPGLRGVECVLPGHHCLGRMNWTPHIDPDLLFATSPAKTGRRVRCDWGHTLAAAQTAILLLQDLDIWHPPCWFLLVCQQQFPGRYLALIHDAPGVQRVLQLGKEDQTCGTDPTILKH